MLQGKTLREFCEELGSAAPTPGGGSAAALVGALSAALVAMVANLTIGKEKYAELEDEMTNVCCAVTELKDKLLGAIDEDKAAFDQVMAAYRMPQGTEQEKVIRREAIEKALKCAAAVPLEVTRYAYEILTLAKTVAEKGNPNAVSDAGAAAVFAEAAAKAAILNVKINLSSIVDRHYAKELGEAAESLLVKCEILKNKVLHKVESTF